MDHEAVPDGYQSWPQVREHYQVEKALARTLRSASKDERRSLYSSVYDEMYRRVPFHPMLTRKASPQERASDAAYQMIVLRPLLNAGDTYLELGPGDCALAFEVCKLVKEVVAIDVSDEITHHAAKPANFRLILSDGSSVPVAPGSIGVAYSNQLMEHLHPDDAFDQLQNVHRALAPGGRYLCITPNRLSGPHDVSRHFDQEASGFHLFEYDTAQLASLFRRVGFHRLRAVVGAKGRFVHLPVAPLIVCERLLSALPYRARIALARNLPLRFLLGNIRLIGTKR